MVKNIDIAPDGLVRVDVWLTVAGCPLRDTIIREVTAAVGAVEGVSRVRVELDVMSDEQRRALQTQLRGGQAAPEIPFSQPTSLTRVFAVASGKGGVGKSSVTVNLAAALAASGAKVGGRRRRHLRAFGPRMLGVTGTPTQVEKMIMPPSAHRGEGRLDRDVHQGQRAGRSGAARCCTAPCNSSSPTCSGVTWTSCYWTSPPGTGDIAISVAQMLPTAELLVVTAPQLAAAEVAERAGAVAVQTHQRIAGVVETFEPRLPALRGAHRHLRLRRRPDRRRGADPDHRGAGPAARPGADRHPAARGRRRGPPAGAQRPIRTRCSGAQQDRRRPGQPGSRPRGQVPPLEPALARPLLYRPLHGLRRGVHTGPANRASGPVSGRGPAKYRSRGAERGRGFRRVAPRASTANRASERVSRQGEGRRSTAAGARSAARSAGGSPRPAQRTGPPAR